MGYKMIIDVINTLCPGSSHLYDIFNDPYFLLAKDSDKVWHKYQRDIKLKYTNLISALCSCTKVAKRNNIGQKVCRSILYKGTTNDELRFMKDYQFMFTAGTVRRTAKRDFESS